MEAVKYLDLILVGNYESSCEEQYQIAEIDGTDLILIVSTERHETFTGATVKFNAKICNKNSLESILMAFEILGIKSIAKEE
jgi:hypothetical protein